MPEDPKKIYSQINSGPLGLLNAFLALRREVMSTVDSEIERVRKDLPKVSQILSSMHEEHVPGHTPTDEELTALIKPLIPEPLNGETPSDDRLLRLIKPLIPVLPEPKPVEVVKMPSKQELEAIIKPLIPEPTKIPENVGITEYEVTEIVKSLIPEDKDLLGEDLVNKINGLEIKPSLQIDFVHIKNWEKFIRKLIPKIGKLIKGGGATGSAVLTEYDNGNSGTSKTIDFATNGPLQKVTLTGNCAFTFIPPVGAKDIRLRLIQDSTGSRTISLTNTLKNTRGVAIILSTASSAVDFWDLYYDGTNFNWGTFDVK